MSKSILVFIANKPFGVFSNKTNAWLAISSNVNVGSLVVSNDSGSKYLSASYSILANRLKKLGKCFLLEKSKVEDPSLEKIPPAVHVFQYETNVAVDGKLYKSGEVEEDSVNPTEESSEQVEGIHESVSV